MTKTKKLVAIFATLAIGATAAAGIALASNFSGNSLSAYAATTDDEVEVAKLETGVNEITLVAGVSQTFGINSNSAGIYGFELPYTLDEEDNSHDYDEFSATITLNVNGTEYTLDENNPLVEVELNAPLSTTVILTSDIDVEFDLHLTYDYEYNYFSVDFDNPYTNSIALVANTYSYAIIQSKVAGYYTFTRVCGSATMEFTYYMAKEDMEDDYELVTETKELNEYSDPFTVNLEAPYSVIIPVISSIDTTLVFTISYSETDPDANEGDLKVGTQEVNASAWGEEYTFISTTGGVYVLYSGDDNAYIMVETEYGSEEVNIEYSEDYEYIVSATYTFALTSGGSITFFMCTYDWSDDTYEITISTKSDLEIGTQSVFATYDGESYTFTSDEGGTYILSCDDDNSYIGLDLGNGVSWIDTPYTFTLSAGGSITFLMATEGDDDDIYDVTITEVVEEVEE